jgi:hypothetical protein
VPDGSDSKHFDFIQFRPSRALCTCVSPDGTGALSQSAVFMVMKSAHRSWTCQTESWQNWKLGKLDYEG